MSNVTDIFDEQTNADVIRRLPQGIPHQDNHRVPWELIRDDALPPMMFQLRFADGRITSFPYSGVCELHCRDAGRLEVFVQGVAKTAIILEGRHLRELAKQFGLAAVLWLRESDGRDLNQPESTPEITRITLEEMPD